MQPITYEAVDVSALRFAIEQANLNPSAQHKINLNATTYTFFDTPYNSGSMPLPSISANIEFIGSNTKFRMSLGVGVQIPVLFSITYLEQVTVTIRDIAFENFDASNLIVIHGDNNLQHLNLIDCEFSGNKVEFIVRATVSIVTIDKCIFDSNTDGILVKTNHSKLTIANTVFRNNVSTFDDIQLIITGRTDVEIFNTDFEYNSYNDKLLILSLDNIRPYEPYNYSGLFRLNECTFQNNSATSIIYPRMVSSEKFEAINCQFVDNTASNYGGAISSRECWDTSLLLEGCLFDNNEASNEGGALDLGNGNTTNNTTTIVKDSIFNNNRSLMGNGGAIYSATTKYYNSQRRCCMNKFRDKRVPR